MAGRGKGRTACAKNKIQAKGLGRRGIRGGVTVHGGVWVGENKRSEADPEEGGKSDGKTNTKSLVRTRRGNEEETPE